MNGQINFLRQRRSAVDAQMRKDKKIARYTMIGLGVFLAVVVGIVITRILFEVQNRRIVAQADQAKAQIRSFSKIEQEYILFVKKVQLMHSLDQQRVAKREAVQFFYELVPQNNVIQQVELDAKQSRIVFQVEAPNVFSMLDLLAVFRSKVTEDVLYSLQITNLTRKPDGAYVIAGSLGYEKLAEAAAATPRAPAAGGTAR